MTQTFISLLVHLVGLEQKPVAPSAPGGAFPLTSLCRSHCGYITHVDSSECCCSAGYLVHTQIKYGTYSRRYGERLGLNHLEEILFICQNFNLTAVPNCSSRLIRGQAQTESPERTT